MPAGVRGARGRWRGGVGAGVDSGASTEGAEVDLDPEPFSPVQATSKTKISHFMGTLLPYQADVAPRPWLFYSEHCKVFVIKRIPEQDVVRGQDGQG